MTGNEVGKEEIEAYLTANTPPGGCSCVRATKAIAMSCATGWGTYMDGACAWCYLNSYRAQVRAVWSEGKWETSASKIGRLWLEAFVDAYQQHRPGVPFTPAEQIQLTGEETEIALQVANPGLSRAEVVEYANFKQRTFPVGPRPINWWAETIDGWRDRLTDIEAITFNASGAHEFTADSVRKSLYRISNLRAGMRRALRVGFQRVASAEATNQRIGARLAEPMPFEAKYIEPADIGSPEEWLFSLLNLHQTQWQEWEGMAVQLEAPPGERATFRHPHLGRGEPLLDEEIPAEILRAAAESFITVCDDLSEILRRRRLPTPDEIRHTQPDRDAEAAAFDALTIRTVGTLLYGALIEYFQVKGTEQTGLILTRRPDRVRNVYGEEAGALIEHITMLETELRSVPAIQAEGNRTERATLARTHLTDAHAQLADDAVERLAWVFRFPPPE